MSSLVADKDRLLMATCASVSSTMPVDHHDECVGMLPSTQGSNVAATSTQIGMPGTIKTTEPPVVFCMAPIHAVNPEAEMMKMKIQG